MKVFSKILILLGLLSGCGTSAFAQILYKVEKNGSEKKSYILGTHHFAPLAVIDSISQLPDIINSIDKFYGEMDMSIMADPIAMTGMQKYLMAPADSTLDKVLNEDQLSKLSIALNTLTGTTVPIEMMYGVKPAVLSTQIAALLSQKVFPELNPMEGLDNTLQNRAKACGKKVEGLESLEFQMDILYNRPIAKQAEELMESIEDLETVVTQSKTICNAYLNHDLDTILKLMEEEKDDIKEMERLIYSRNANWVKILSEEMPESSLMIVVGAGHLPGGKGILEGLRSKGFTVTPII
ncbi:MAG: TraB/GumN family protein [Muribaculaceae bacterium]|nr:TraB/GumN family protein [Muribaculaceae bacterium]